MTDCPVCLIEHHEATHAATLRVHAWFREQVTLALVEVTEGKRRTEPSWPGPGAKPKPEAARRPGGRVYERTRSDVTAAAIRALGQMPIVEMAKCLKCSERLISQRLRQGVIRERLKTAEVAG